MHLYSLHSHRLTITKVKYDLNSLSSGIIWLFGEGTGSYSRFS